MSMEGWLLDTNTVDYLVDQNDANHAAVRDAFRRLPGAAPVFISAITMGEIEYGIAAYPRMPESKKAELRRAFGGFLALDVTQNTREYYGCLRAALFEKAIGQGKKGLRPEQLVDPATSRQLGVQENDIWITALAVEYNLTLVTHDRKMRRLWELAGDEFRVVDWADPGFMWPGSK